MTIDAIKAWLDGVASWLLSVLPLSPFQQFVPDMSEFGQGLGWLNWFLPIHAFSVIMSVWLLSIATFYLYRAILHWTGLDD